MKRLIQVTFIALMLLFVSYFAQAQTRHFVKHDAIGDNNGTSWAHAFTSFQSALNAASSGHEIWVAAGTYKPSFDYGLGGGSRYFHFRMINGVEIYGGFDGTEDPGTFDLAERDFEANETILSGDLGIEDDNSDNCYHIFYHPNGLALTSSAVLDGFTVQHGYANGASEHSRGGGIHNYSSSPTLNNLIIRNNLSTHNGGGLYNFSSSSPNVTNSIIEYNTAPNGGGVFNGSTSSPSFVNVLIRHNDASSGGGGVYNITSSSPTFTNVLIADNDGGSSGGGIHNSSSGSVTLVNVTIVNNNATNGGGIFCLSTISNTIYNSIIWDNYAPSQGHQIYTDGSTINLYYSNYNNSSDDVQVNGSGAVNPDINTIFVAPQFVDSDNEDYRLFGSSVSVNSGDNNENSETFDIRGQARIQNTTIDMGAYEWTNGIDPNCIPPTDGGEIADNQTICYNTVPDEIENTTLPTGHTGDLEYLWQNTTLNPDDSEFDDSDWNDIANSNSASYQAVALTQTTWYRRLARADCEADWIGVVNSNIIGITVRPQFLTGAISTTGESICYNGNPVEIGSTTPASGGDGAISYQWQSSTISGASGFSDINDATSATFDPPAGLTETTWYRRLAQDGTCNTTLTASSGVWNVTVDHPTVFVSDDYDEFTSGWEITHFDNLNDALAISCDAATVNISNYTHSGDVDMTGYTFIIGDDDFDLDGVLSGGLIQTPSTGRLILPAVQNVQKDYPMGDGNNNYTLKIIPLNAPTNPIIVRLYEQSIPGAVKAPMPFWDIEGDDNLDATIVFRIDKSAIAPKKLNTNSILRFFDGDKYVPVTEEQVTINDKGSYYEIIIINVNKF